MSAAKVSRYTISFLNLIKITKVFSFIGWFVHIACGCIIDHKLSRNQARSFVKSTLIPPSFVNAIIIPH